MKKYINFSFAVLILALANVAPIFAQTCQPAPVRLVSWWSADNNTLDLRSRNNGTLNGGADFAPGIVGQGFRFDADNEHLLVPASPSLNVGVGGSLTLEAWVNPTSLNPGGSGFGPIFEWGSGGGVQLGRLNNGVLFANIQDTGPTNHFIQTGQNAIVPNQFQHVALTYNSATGTGIIYVNGVAVATQNLGSFTPRTDAELRLGIRGGSDSFIGIIDEPSIYNRALSASEVQAIFNAGQAGKCKPTATVAPSGQVAWFAGDGDARDLAGTNNGTLQNGAGFAVGKVGQSLAFDGTDDSVRLPLTQTFQTFTLETWVKPLAAVNDAINQELILGQAGFGSQIAVIPGTNGGIKVKVQFRDTINSFVQLTSTIDIPINDWSHLTGTYDGTTLKLFINGVLNNQLNPANTTVLTCNTPYFIGGFQTVTDCNNVTNQPFQFFNGLIDEASVYNRALTDAEITSIFNAGVAGKLKQNQTIDTNSLVSLWLGEGNANDARGANNGAFAANTYAPGKVGQAFQANGGIISVPDSASLDFTNAYTIEMWVSPNVAGQPDGSAFFACKGDCFVANNQPYSLGFLDTRTVYLTVGNNSAIDRVVSVSALPLNAFSHVAGTYDGTTMRIYINGVLDNSKTTSIGTLVNSSLPFTFGGTGFSTTAGIYDEVALYNRALTAAEVRANYESGNALSTVVGDARITFPTVATAETTQQIPLETSDFPALTMGTHTGLIYDIDTSATFTGNPTVCFNLPSFTTAQFSNLRVMHFENNNWVDVTAASNAFPMLCTQPVASFSPFAIALLPPTAASVTIGGRVREANGKGIFRARVTLTDAAGETRTTLTNLFGSYRFDDVPSGATYILSVSHRDCIFEHPSRVLFVNEPLDAIDFIASP